MSIPLPAELSQFLADGGAGEHVLHRHGPVVVWSAAAVESLNQAYEMPSHAPGLTLIGSDRRDLALAVSRTEDGLEFGEVPFIGISARKFICRARSWQAYLSFLKPAPESASADSSYWVYRRPALFGGRRDTQSLMCMTEQDHIDYVLHWNRIVMQLRS
jgi:hypothetical protein